MHCIERGAAALYIVCWCAGQELVRMDEMNDIRCIPCPLQALTS